MGSSSGPATFVVGCPRSGTTALAVMLARHPRLAVPPETHYFTKLLPQLRRKEPEERLEWALTDPHLKDLELEGDEIQWRVKDPAVEGSIFRGIMEAYAAKHEKPRWIEKTPDHLLVAHRIHRRLPDARFLCLVRDGRDTALSLQKVPWASNDIVENAAHWRRAAEFADELRQTWPKDRFRIVRFEDLVREPELHLRRICEFVKVKFLPCMLDPAVEVDTIPEWEREWKENANRLPDPSRIGAWKNAIDAPTQSLLNFLQGPLLERFGYRDLEVGTLSRELRRSANRKRLELGRRALVRRAARQVGDWIGWDYA